MMTAVTGHGCSQRWRERREGMNLDHKIREAETRLFAGSGLQPEESFLDLDSVKVRLRVLSVGTGPPLVMLHGVSLAAAVWAPWLAGFAGYRALLVELPGHGLSGPAPAYEREPRRVRPMASAVATSAVAMAEWCLESAGESPARARPPDCLV
jgi:hypothetical protein